MSYFRGDLRLKDLLPRHDLRLSVIVLGELWYGASRAQRPDRQLQQIAVFMTDAQLLTLGLHTAEAYGVVKSELTSRGELIPDNDIWIAATALEHKLPLATRDAHFDRITGLQVLRW